MVAPFGEHPFHAASAEQYRDSPFDPGAEPLAELKGPTLLKGLPLGTPLTAGLRDAGAGHARLVTSLQVRGTEEAAIGAIHIRGVAKRIGVAGQRGRDM